jgi:uncharacterized membrane protein YdjX (TVP38/TMEM64 family)
MSGVPPSPPTKAGAWTPWVKFAVLVVLLVGIGAGYARWGDQFQLDRLVAREAQLQQNRVDHPLLVYGVAFGVYVLVTALSLPAATILSLTIGWYFGFWRGVVLVSFASTTGATLAFLMSRYLLRDAIQGRFGDRLQTFNAALDREGAFYLFALRLTPAVPFFVVNLVMGLTRLRARSFWWVSQVGMLPATCVFLYAGASVPDLKTLAEKGTVGILSPQLVAAFVLLGIFPLAARYAMRRWRQKAMPGEKVSHQSGTPLETTITRS